jgi:poly(3-hydroxyalkanoate) synthetase
LQSSEALTSSSFGRFATRFRNWYASTVDLPGTYYLQVVEHLFKENRLATGRFVALGRRIDLSNLRCPLSLLAARDDDVVAPEQVFATERLVDAKRCAVRKSVAPFEHLGLFMGKQTLAEVWPRISRWLNIGDEPRDR